ncbi:phage tail tip lysozyme [Brachybacterium kimchii]|uniref:Phage tail tip lysozyme n=1 Tax=Brachybacterium kimchii TaxID=2942909 RepID=A0ABY4N7K3_9MICO|nr:phage tail tip lysozyme [Brachybacterium kimchii]UQN30540.1 phage tail tip lysozyme [Brachybacterium kimchii]
MANEHAQPGDITGDSSTPEPDDLEGPGTGDLGSGADGGSSSQIADTGKQLAQKGAEIGVKKATGSDMAVSAVQGAQKARNGDIVGGAQDVAASGAGAATSAALASTGVGAPVAGLAGSAVTSIFKTKAFRWAIGGIAFALALIIALETFYLAAVASAVIAAIAPASSQTTAFASECQPGSTSSAVGDPGAVVGDDIREKVWNYLRGAGYSEEQAAGVMGNIERESKFNPFVSQGGSGTPTVSSGWALVQWTADRHAAVRDAVIKELGAKYYVGAPTIDQLPGSLTDEDVDKMVLFQMRYIISELEGPEKAAGDALANSTSVEDATRVFESKYERAGVSAIDERVANAQKIYEQFKGSKVPDAGGTDPGDESGNAPDPGGDAAAPATSSEGDEASSSGESTQLSAATSTTPDPGPSGTTSTASCASTTTSGTTEAGSVKPCPDGKDGCVNVAELTKSSKDLKCPEGTSDGGVVTAYFEGTGKEIRLCNLDGATTANGGPVQFNAMVATNFVAFYNEAKKAGLDPGFTSTFRSHEKQQSLYASSPGGAARPGYSNHEFGMAADIDGFSASYSRNNCGPSKTKEGACSYPGEGAELERWKELRKIGLKHGLYIHDQEFWHIEAIPSGSNRDRNIDIYKG